MIVMSVFHNRFEEVMKRLRNWRRNLECPLWKIFLMTTFCTKYLILTKGMSNIFNILADYLVGRSLHLLNTLEIFVTKVIVFFAGLLKI